MVGRVWLLQYNYYIGTMCAYDAQYALLFWLKLANEILVSPAHPPGTPRAYI